MARNYSTPMPCLNAKTALEPAKRPSQPTGLRLMERCAFKRAAADSTCVRQGKATTYQGPCWWFYLYCLRKNGLCRAMCANCSGANVPPKSSSSMLSTLLA